MKTADYENLEIFINNNFKKEILPNKTSFMKRVSKSSITTLHSETAFEAMLLIISKTVNADACSLFLSDPDTNSHKLVIAQGIKKADINSINIGSGEGICGWVFNHQRAFISNNIKDDRHFNDNIKLEFKPDNYNIVAAPLMLNGKCLGIVEIINWNLDNVFTKKDLNFLDTLSNMMAVLVENELLFDKCCQQLHQRNTVLDLTKAVNIAKELPDLLNFIVKTGAELLNAEASSLLLREDDVLRFEIALGEKGTKVEKFTVPLGSGIAGSVALSGKATFINNADSKDSGIYKEIDRRSGFTTRNLIAVPLIVSDRIIGVLEVINCRDKTGFNEDDISLLDGFANGAAIAIEKAQLVEKRIQAERLATIGRTVAGLAHCIKNITNALKAGEYIVDKGFRDENIEQIRKGWDISKQGSERIRDLVSNMLTISKKRKPEYTLCCPNEIASEVVTIIKEEATAKNIKIKTRFDREIGQVKVDRKQIFRCLLNLSSNAIDACEGLEGKIEVGTFKMKKKPFFGYRIIDNGQGIREQDQKKLFHEFFSSKGSKGTGLGLSVTHAFITEHGGSIKCDSQSGKGTTFTIKLPVKQ